MFLGKGALKICSKFYRRTPMLKCDLPTSWFLHAFFMVLLKLSWYQFAKHRLANTSIIFNALFSFFENYKLTVKGKVSYQPASLNISTGHWTMFGENRVMLDKSCFTKHTVIRSEVKKIIISYRRPQTQKHSVSTGLFLFLTFWK